MFNYHLLVKFVLTASTLFQLPICVFHAIINAVNVLLIPIIFHFARRAVEIVQIFQLVNAPQVFISLIFLIFSASHAIQTALIAPARFIINALIVSLTNIFIMEIVWMIAHQDFMKI
jgi:hypothetical protein